MLTVKHCLQKIISFCFCYIQWNGSPYYETFPAHMIKEYYQINIKINLKIRYQYVGNKKKVQFPRKKISLSIFFVLNTAWNVNRFQNLPLFIQNYSASNTRKTEFARTDLYKHYCSYNLSQKNKDSLNFSSSIHKRLFVNFARDPLFLSAEMPTKREIWPHAFDFRHASYAAGFLLKLWPYLLIIFVPRKRQ